MCAPRVTRHTSIDIQVVATHASNLLTHRTPLVVKKKKKTFFSFLVAVKNSIKLGPLVFLL